MSEPVYQNHQPGHAINLQELRINRLELLSHNGHNGNGSHNGHEGNNGEREKALSLESAQPETEMITERHPVVILRNISVTLYDALERFINLYSRPTGRVGFKEETQESAKVDELLELSGAGIEGITSLMFAGAFTKPTKGLGRLASDIKAILQELRLSLIDSSFKNGIPEGDLGNVVRHCIAVQRSLADPFITLTNATMGT